MPSLIDPTIVCAFAPTGKLRASINLGNPLLANRDPQSGEPVGVSLDLARAFAHRLGVECEWVVFEKAAQSVAAVKAEQADIGFFAIDPARSEGLRFTAPYVLIEGSYLVEQNSPLQNNDEVDRAGQRVGVASGSAYDLFLTRALQSAPIERMPHVKDVIAALRAGHIEVAAGIRKQLEAAIHDAPDFRLLPGRFMVIEQAMGMPASRGVQAAATLSAFVEDMKANGFVAAALARHGIQGAIVAAPEATQAASDR